MITDDNIGLQLWTVREQLSSDLPGTLSSVASAGYRVVEVAGYGVGGVSEMQSRLSRFGLQAVSTHVTPHQMTSELNASLQDATRLGCEYIVLSGSPKWSRASLASVERLADRLNEWGAACRSVGLQFGYHNHAREFWDLEGTCMFDVLVRGCDPELVHFEIDVYWIMHAREDPVKVIKRCAGRVFLLHAKEMSRLPDRRDTKIGDGVTPWNEIIAEAERSGVKWLFVEQEDEPDSALDDIVDNRSKLAELLMRQAPAQGLDA